MTLNDSCHKHASTLFYIHDICHVMVMKVSCQSCTPLQEKCYPLVLLGCDDLPIIILIKSYNVTYNRSSVSYTEGFDKLVMYIILSCEEVWDTQNEISGELPNSTRAPHSKRNG